ncbi:WD40 repeat-like protein, partial [Thelephora ganbajun]
SVARNPTKPLLASCSTDKTVRSYKYRIPPPSSEDETSSYYGEGLKFELNNSIATGHAKTIRAPAWSPSGNTLATGSFNSNVGIWQQVGEEDEEGAWECVSSLEGHETECKGVAYSASETLLTSCSRDKSVWVWEVLPDADFECIGVLIEHSQDVKSVAWHPREEILASCSYDGTIRIWIDDPQDDWDCVAILRGHTSTVWSMSFSPDGNYIASGSDDRTVRIWKRWDCVQVLEGYHDRTIFSVAWGEGNPVLRGGLRAHLTANRSSCTKSM